MASASALALGASFTRALPSASFPRALPSASKVYIAVMGATGSGKSSSISSITGKEGIVGHNFETGLSPLVECNNDINARRPRDI